MDRKGFTLIELLGCLALLGIVLGIGLFVTKDTLSTSLSILTDVSSNQIKDAAELYMVENKISWVNVDNKEYACIMVMELVDTGYFSAKDVVMYKNDYIQIIRKPVTKVVESIQILDECE